MRYQSTVLRQLLKVIPRGRFERIAERYRSGRKKRRLAAWDHFVTMVYAQLSGAKSLRELERVLERHPGTLAHLGLERVRRATLADANAGRPAALFEAIVASLASELGSGRDALRLIDATRVFAGKRIESWAQDGAVKLHVMLDPASGRPICFAVSPNRVNDIVAAKAMPIEPGATYVFDKGYYDFGFWVRLDAAGCRFVTRLKSNSPTTLVEQRAVLANTAILADRVALLSERLSHSRKNPYGKPLRVIDVRIDTGRMLTLVTNDLTAPADAIAALYKARWQIELFFKWIKQNLKLTRFLGVSPNAVTIQILAALAAYLLLRINQRRLHSPLSLTACANLVGSAILARRNLVDLLNTPPPASPDPSPQLGFAI
jgi:hypothetical protein